MSPFPHEPYEPQPAEKASATPVPTLLKCAVGNCRNLQLNWHTGFCDYHQARFEDHVHCHTREIGRGIRL